MPWDFRDVYFRHKWIRVYGLPGGKSIASSHEERQEMLERFREVMVAGINKDEDRVFIQVAIPSNSGELENELNNICAGCFAIWKSITDDEGVAFTLYVATTELDSALIDQVLNLVIDDRIDCFVCGSNGCVFHPYYAGIDCFFAEDTMNKIGLIRNQFSSYLSPLPNGM
jgi:hypothetical protein